MVAVEIKAISEHEESRAGCHNSATIATGESGTTKMRGMALAHRGGSEHDTWQGERARATTMEEEEEEMREGDESEGCQVQASRESKGMGWHD